MEIKITKACKKMPTFADLNFGDIFMCEYMGRPDEIFMKITIEATNKTKALLLSKGIVIDFDKNKSVRFCDTTLNVRVEQY